ncbi:MAG: hypothetical protein HZB23_12305 [Deltaproteobacteria bacterium]|nr:hypothetical protein [Deltaproteobacteria bacterium]
MKWFILLMMFFLQACTATVHIVNVSPIHREGAYGVFLVETQEDLSTFEDGFHAYKVSVFYRIGSSANGVYDIFSADQFPFVATRIDYADKERRRNVSKWRIPLKHEIGISGRTYSYDISKQAAELIIVLYGATMGGGHVVSEPHSVKIEAVK